MSDDEHRERIEELLEDDPYDTDMMRNPERIEPMCEALKEYWNEHPDQRLGQLVTNLSTMHDPFHVEDIVIMNELGMEFEDPLFVDEDEVSNDEP